MEKAISEQTDFFHLNRGSSSMASKVDFDLTMTILAHNLFRLFAFEVKDMFQLNEIYKHLKTVPDLYAINRKKTSDK